MRLLSEKIHTVQVIVKSPILPPPPPILSGALLGLSGGVEYCGDGSDGYPGPS